MCGAGVAGCAPALFTPPAGPGEPAPDAAAVWAEATRACRAVTSYVGTIIVSGRIADQGLPAVRVVTGATAAGGMRLEASVHNTQIFKLASAPGHADRATLLLYDGNRSFVGSAEEIVDALVGARINPARWFALLTGCATSSPDLQQASRYGTIVAVTTADGRAFLDRTDEGWRVGDATFDDLTVAYRTRAGGWPRDWTLASMPGRDPAVRLSVRVEHQSIDEPLGPEAFTLDVHDAAPMTLDELRASGPLRRHGVPVPAPAGADASCPPAVLDASSCHAR